MNKLILIIFLIILLFISSCSKQQDTIIEDKTEIECFSDDDCSVGGCSSQICTTKEKAPTIITTCEFKEEYSCLEKTSCVCFEGKCQFEQNQDYLNCLAEFDKIEQSLILNLKLRILNWL